MAHREIHRRHAIEIGRPAAGHQGDCEMAGQGPDPANQQQDQEPTHGGSVFQCSDVQIPPADPPTTLINSTPGFLSKPDCVNMVLAHKRPYMFSCSDIKQRGGAIDARSPGESDTSTKKRVIMVPIRVWMHVTAYSVTIVAVE